MMAVQLVQESFPGIEEAGGDVSALERARKFPPLRFMGSKHRLLPWIHEIFCELEFDTCLDAFSGSGCVGYLLKSMGKEVTTNDRLNFSAVIARALVENNSETLGEDDLTAVLKYDPRHPHFIENTFKDIFFSAEDLRFLDRASWNIANLCSPAKQALATSALIRSCVKRQPRGVFTIAGDPEHYKDGRRDLRLSLQEHFLEQAAVLNEAVFDNGRSNRAEQGDVFSVSPEGLDLVYLDPPYVPRADDNCYVKRYHFLEGLSCYWKGMTIMKGSKVRKIKKPYIPFSYRKDAIPAFEKLFERFSESIIVFSYSSNGYPDLEELVKMLGRVKRSVQVHARPHRYHFGTHEAVRRVQVEEYLIVGR